MRLDQAVEQILDAVVEAVSSDPALAEVRSVVRGDRARPMPALPAVWVVPEPATQDADTYGSAEAWTMPVGLAALVRSEDPEQGGRDAGRLAALARSAVLATPGLGLAHVVDVRSTRIDLAARSERNRSLFWADATVTVTFVVDE